MDELKQENLEDQGELNMTMRKKNSFFQVQTKVEAFDEIRKIIGFSGLLDITISDFNRFFKLILN